MLGHARRPLVVAALALLACATACKSESPVDREARSYGLPPPFAMRPHAFSHRPHAEQERLLGMPQSIMITVASEGRSVAGAGGDAKAALERREPEVETWSLDRRGWLISIAGARKDYRYTYDDDGRLVEQHETTDGKTYSKWYRYDDEGREIHQEQKDPSGRSKTISTTYESSTELVQTRSSPGDGVQTIEYALDRNGRVVERRFAESGKVERKEYDAKGRLIRESDRKTEDGEVATTRYDYVEDDDSVTMTMTSARGRSIAITQDARHNKLDHREHATDGRLEHDWTYDYELDAIGNWTRMAFHSAGGEEEPRSTTITTREITYWE